MIGPWPCTLGWNTEAPWPVLPPSQLQSVFSILLIPLSLLLSLHSPPVHEDCVHFPAKPPGRRMLRLTNNPGDQQGNKSTTYLRCYLSTDWFDYVSLFHPFPSVSPAEPQVCFRVGLRKRQGSTNDRQSVFEKL